MKWQFQPALTVVMHTNDGKIANGAAVLPVTATVCRVVLVVRYTHSMATGSPKLIEATYV